MASPAHETIVWLTAEIAIRGATLEHGCSLEIRPVGPVVVKVATLLLLALLGLGTGVLVISILDDDSSADEESFAAQLRLAVGPLHNEYTVPLVQAARENGVLCEYVQPATGSEDCDRYVDAVADANPALLDSIATLKELKLDLPIEFERRMTTLLDEVIALYALAFESNELIIDGWRSQDDAAWEQGWHLRDEVIARGARVVESAEELQQLGAY